MCILKIYENDYGCKNSNAIREFINSLDELEFIKLLPRKFLPPDMNVIYRLAPVIKNPIIVDKIKLRMNNQILEIVREYPESILPKIDRSLVLISHILNDITYHLCMDIYWINNNEIDIIKSRYLKSSINNIDILNYLQHKFYTDEYL